MKFAYISGAALLGLVMGISGCGGGGGGSPAPADDNNDGNGDSNPSTTLSISGTITGNDASVTLALNGTEETFAGSEFTFTQELDDNSFYAVSFVSIPNDQNCVVANGAGVITADVSNVEVTCSSAITTLKYDDASLLGAFAIGDYNGDGMSDIAMPIKTTNAHSLGSNNDMVRFIYGTGAGGFSGMNDVTALNSAPGSWQDKFITTEINNDGNDDIAYSNDRLQTYIGNNTNSPSNNFSSPENVGSILSFDMDGDGDSDIVSNIHGLHYPNSFAIYKNNGDGSFGSTEFFNNLSLLLDSDPTTPSIRNIYKITAADVNGDDKMDIVAIVHDNDFVNPAIYGITTYLGNNSGGFDNPTTTQAIDQELWLGEANPIIRAMDSADIDRDGDNDLVITSSTNYVQVYLNDGSGTFSEGQKVTGGTVPVDVKAADINNDSNLDIITANDTTKNVVVHYGIGDGTFYDDSNPDNTWLDIKLDNDVELTDLDISDFDGDSYLDIVIGEASSHTTAAGSIQIIHSPGQ